MFGRSAGKYLNVRYTPDKGALEDLPAARLKKLGVTVEDAGDEAIVKPVDGEIEKFVDALLDDKTGGA